MEETFYYVKNFCEERKFFGQNCISRI